MLMKEYQRLADNLKSIEKQLEQAENMLNYATDELLIDSIIYEIESLYKRHAYYLRLLRELKTMAGEGYAV